LGPVPGKFWPIGSDPCCPIGRNLWRQHNVLGSIHQV
jgi:hypothetical protein